MIFANGAPAESLYPGPQALKALDPQSRDEILTIFPELAEAALPRTFAAARMTLKSHEAKVLLRG